MSLLERVIIAHRCRSTHHYIAMDSLPLMTGEDAEKWRNLILVHNEELLEGAKAPDAKFKDFKNHVLHVAEGEWGGARDAAMKWYAEAVAQFRAKKWGKAIYALGVLSHYYADPIQPFHTGQTEEEGAMHRAVEWSIAKSRATIKARIDELGYPEIETSQSLGFVSDMVRAGAEKSHVHYQTVIDHYNLDVGAKHPEAGLDQTLVDVFAELIAYATAGLATLFSRAIAEAGVKAPRAFITVPGYLATLDIPIRWVTQKLDDERDQRTVNAMYREYKKTGKVLKTLSDDDKRIRRMHARQVLRRPIEELDAQPLKPFGQAFEPREEFAEVVEEILLELEPEADEIIGEEDTVDQETVAEEVVDAPEVAPEVEVEANPIEDVPEDVLETADEEIEDAEEIAEDAPAAELKADASGAKPVIRIAADIAEDTDDEAEELTPHEAREFERIEAEEAARHEAERAEREERERLQAEEAARLEAEQAAAEKERRFIEEREAQEAAERAEREERERLQAEEAERIEFERLEAEEAERIAREEAEFAALVEAEEARERAAQERIAEQDDEAELSDTDESADEYEFTFEELAAFDTNLTENGDLPQEMQTEDRAAPPPEAFFETSSSETDQPQRARSRLFAEDPVIDAPSIGKKTARRLNRVGIFNIGDLIACDSEEIAFELDARHIDEPTLEEWKAQARLMMDVPGLRVHDAQILVGAGIRSAEDLANASATRIFHASMGFLKSNQASPYLREHELEESEVNDWIEMANEAEAA